MSLIAACSGGGGGNDNGNNGGGGPPPPLAASRTFRAIAGVSMGGYGALNLGTKRRDLFGTIGSLGGPVDMQQLLRDSITDNLEVKAETSIPRNVGDDFTFDHLPPYPDRDTRISQFQDLVIAFGNPFLHHPDPARQYLATDSEPARLLRDDQFDTFTLTGDPRGFLDGGDANKNGLRETSEAPTVPVDVMLLARGSAETLSGGVAGQLVGNRELVDLNGDGIYDVGDGIVVNYSEPFDDANGNFVFDPGETFQDVGLDGVPGTGDFGEGNGQFDYDPDRAHVLAEDPTSRIAAAAAADVASQRIYMDVGIKDEFGFARHYANLVQTLQAKGLTVEVQEGFGGGNCADLPDSNAQFRLVRYDAGHVGVASVDPDDLFSGDVCGNDTVWQRLLSLLGYLNQAFPDGFKGPGGDLGGIGISLDPKDFKFGVDLPDPDLRGEIISATLDSPSLATAGGPVPTRDVLVYRPPAFHRTDKQFPVAYFLGGYGQKPDDFARMNLLLDGLILTGQLQNMFVVVLPGNGGREGSFYVNHVVPESQVPDIPQVTSGRYEDSTITDLIPVIEDQLLDGRVRR